MVSLQRLLLAETNKTAGKGDLFIGSILKEQRRCLELRGSHLITAQEIVIESVAHIFFPICFLPLKIFFFVVVSKVRSSLVVQWLRLLAPNAGGLDLIPDLELDPTCHN